MTDMYQESTGGLAAALPGDPVGSVLDASRGEPQNLLPLVITSGWTEVSTGLYEKLNTGFSSISQNGLFPPPVGSLFKVTVEVVQRTSGTIQVYRRMADNSGNQVVRQSSEVGTFVALVRVVANSGVGNTGSNTGAWVDSTSFIGRIRVKFELVSPYLAEQSTALSRPTLARTPKGYRRNLLTNSVTTIGWSSSPSTATIAYGASNDPSGNPTMLRVTRLTTGSVNQGYAYTNSSVPVIVLGKTYTLSAVVRNHGYGAIAQVTCGLVVYMTASGNIAGNTYSAFSGATFSLDRQDLGGGLSRISITATATANNASTSGVWLHGGNGAPEPVGAYADYCWPQFEEGNLTHYQHVVNQYDITEIGNSSIWYISNDGGDSLPLNLPAGTYGRAWLDILGNVNVDTVTDPTNALVPTDVNSSQVDVVLRQGAFTTQEIEDITQYWTQRYKA